MVDANLDVSEECVTAFNRMKMVKDLRYIVYKIEGQRTVVVEKTAPLSATYDNLIEDIPNDEPRFAVIDFEGTNSDGIALQKLLFVHWCPDNAKVAPKMVYASTKENLKRRFVGIFKEIQASVKSELTHSSITSDLRL